MTEVFYLNYPYLTVLHSRIINFGLDDKGTYLVLDQTIFYPQGGGQPSDTGIIDLNEKEIHVSFVRHFPQEIRHYVSNIDDDFLNKDCLNANICSKIDMNRRYLNTRYHTAAHLLSNVVETISPELKAVKGHSFPNEAYVEFSGSSVLEVPHIQEKLNEAIASNLETTVFEISLQEFEKNFHKLTYPVALHKDFRVVRIGNYFPIPCGGTHISKISEIGVMKIKKIKTKGEKTKISYGLD
jgi:alanyl-tRNA synthetase